MAYPKFERRITVAANTYGVSVDSGPTVYIPAGDYYWGSVAPGGSVSLASALQTILDPGGIDNATVGISPTTGKLSIVFSDFTSIGGHDAIFVPELLELCGFSSDPTPPDVVFTGDKQVQGLWLPGVGAGGLAAAAASLGRVTRVVRVTNSASGKTGVRQLSDEKVWNHWRFYGLPAAKAHTENESTTNESWETFWRSAVTMPVRFYTDATVSTSYQTTSGALRDYWFDEATAGDIGLSPVRPDFDGLWVAEFSGHLNV